MTDGNSQESVARGGRVGIRTLAVSEATKFRSIRSTWISLAIIVVAGIGFSALFSFLIGRSWTGSRQLEHAQFDPVRISQSGIFISQFVAGILGALIVTSEYSTGTIRATLAAAPRRLSVVGAKVIVISAALLVVTEVTAFIAFFVGRSVLISYGGTVVPPGASLVERIARHTLPVVNITSPGVARAVFLGGLYLVLVSLLGLGFGLLLRHTTGTIALYVVILLIVPLLAQLLPQGISSHIVPYLPSNLGLAMTTVGSRSTDFAGQLLSTGAATFTLALYAIAAVGAGATAMIKRDA